MSCNRAYIRVVAIVVVTWCAARAPAAPNNGSSLVVMVRALLDTLTSPSESAVGEADADHYWDAKRECVRSVERSTSEKYPWCEDSDYAVLQRTAIAEMSEVQYDLYRKLHNKCVDAHKSDQGRDYNACADPRLQELSSRPLHDLTSQEYHCFWWLNEKCRDGEEKVGKVPETCTDSVFGALRAIPMTTWTPSEYDYFIHFWERCADESKKRHRWSYDYCADSLFTAVRQKQIEDMTDLEADFFIRCRARCVSLLIDSGYAYSRENDLRYQRTLTKRSSAEARKRQQMFIDDVVHEDEKRSRVRAGEAGITVAAVALPTVVLVVVVVVVSLFAMIPND